MYLVECEIELSKETKTFSTDAKLLKFYTDMSIQLLEPMDGINYFKINCINLYENGKLKPLEIKADNKGIRLMYAEIVEEEPKRDSIVLGNVKGLVSPKTFLDHEGTEPE